MSDLNNYVKNLDMRLYLEAYNQGQPNMPLTMDQFLVDDPLLAAYYNENTRRNPSELKKPHTYRGRADLLLKKDNKVLQQSLNNNSSVADDSVRGGSPLNKTQ